LKKRFRHFHGRVEGHFGAAQKRCHIEADLPELPEFGGIGTPLSLGRGRLN